MPTDSNMFKDHKKDIIRELQVVQKLHSKANPEDIENPLFLMRCLEYYYERTYNKVTRINGF
jgi:hypothetical protein